MKKIVRISRGAFAAESYKLINEMLTQSGETLIPAIKKLNGLMNYYAAIDPVSNTMVNVSIWNTIEDAKQMETLEPMIQLGKTFIINGVQFERPIINYETVWEI